MADGLKDPDLLVPRKLAGWVHPLPKLNDNLILEGDESGDLRPGFLVRSPSPGPPLHHETMVQGLQVGHVNGAHSFPEARHVAK